MQIFHRFWVRKLTGKPAFLTIADSESEARRIHLLYEGDLLLSAAESKAFRIHSDLTIPDRLTAAWTCFDSSGAKRAPIRTPLYSAVLTFGLPAFLVIINV
jgi:hypothetical protein